MDAADLYAIYAEELEAEEFTTAAWEALPPREQLVWGKLARRLPREFTPAQSMLNTYPD